MSLASAVNTVKTNANTATSAVVTGIVTQTNKSMSAVTVILDISNDKTTPANTAVLIQPVTSPVPTLGTVLTVPVVEVKLPDVVKVIEPTFDTILDAQVLFSKACQGAIEIEAFDDLSAFEIELQFTGLSNIRVGTSLAFATGLTILGKNDPRKDAERYRAARNAFLVRANEDPTFA